MAKTIRKTKAHKIRLAIGLFTASQWHSESTAGGRAMLTLSTSRRIQSEEHRSKLIADIKNDINNVVLWSRSKSIDPDANYAEDVQRLGDLWMLVNDAVVGEEWLSDQENMDINEMLFRGGQL